ncbi:MAG: hypothetical protein OEV93_02645 [Candidatus Moranbacteria bacterium]|nr:hypothetical protein [Candidatus Moranbacteria bacterium]
MSDQKKSGMAALGGVNVENLPSQEERMEELTKKAVEEVSKGIFGESFLQIAKSRKVHREHLDEKVAAEIEFIQKRAFEIAFEKTKDGFDWEDEEKKNELLIEAFQEAVVGLEGKELHYNDGEQEKKFQVSKTFTELVGDIYGGEDEGDDQVGQGAVSTPDTSQAKIVGMVDPDKITRSSREKLDPKFKRGHMYRKFQDDEKKIVEDGFLLEEINERENRVVIVTGEGKAKKTQKERLSFVEFQRKFGKDYEDIGDLKKQEEVKEVEGRFKAGHWYYEQNKKTPDLIENYFIIRRIDRKNNKIVIFAQDSVDEKPAEKELTSDEFRSAYSEYKDAGVLNPNDPLDWKKLAQESEKDEKRRRSEFEKKYGIGVEYYKYENGFLVKSFHVDDFRIGSRITGGSGHITKRFPGDDPDTAQQVKLSWDDAKEEWVDIGEFRKLIESGYYIERARVRKEDELRQRKSMNQMQRKNAFERDFEDHFEFADKEEDLIFVFSDPKFNKKPDTDTIAMEVYFLSEDGRRGGLKDGKKRVNYEIFLDKVDRKYDQELRAGTRLDNETKARLIEKSKEKRQEREEMEIEIMGDYAHFAREAMNHIEEIDYAGEFNVSPRDIPDAISEMKEAYWNQVKENIKKDNRILSSRVDEFLKKIKIEAGE